MIYRLLASAALGAIAFFGAVLAGAGCGGPAWAYAAVTVAAAAIPWVTDGMRRRR